MKTTNYLLPSFLLISIHFSCSKEVVEETITGKWQLTERYNSYYNAGDSSWSVVPVDLSSVLEFNESGQYIESVPADSTSMPCTGSYQEIKKNLFRINSSCRTEPYDIRVIITEQRLIISYPDSDIKEKFLRIN